MRSPQARLLAAAWRPLLGSLIVLLVSAGRIDYWQGWVFIFASLTFHVLNALTIWCTPDLAGERLCPGDGIKTWDKYLLQMFRVLFYVVLFTAGLDAGRFRWTLTFPAYFYFLIYIIYALGQLMHIWAKSANIFFSTVVRIQRNRGHSVRTGGPYKFIRHPGLFGEYCLYNCYSLNAWIFMGPHTYYRVYGMLHNTYVHGRHGITQ